MPTNSKEYMREYQRKNRAKKKLEKEKKDLDKLKDAFFKKPVGEDWYKELEENNQRVRDLITKVDGSTTPITIEVIEDPLQENVKNVKKKFKRQSIGVSRGLSKHDLVNRINLNLVDYEGILPIEFLRSFDLTIRIMKTR
ncbi:MAG TPA: hypothetical protein ENI29_21535 [bacterium]|nr:hypothetical protein [bacterium]